MFDEERALELLREATIPDAHFRAGQRRSAMWWQPQ